MDLGGVGLRNGSGHNRETRAWEIHELLELVGKEPAEKSVATAAKIPDDARLGVIDVREIHLRPEIVARKLVEFRGRKRRGEKRECDERGGERGDRGTDRGTLREPFGAYFEKMARQEKREQRKRRERVVRQLGFYQAHNDEHNQDARDEVVVGRVAFPPKKLRQARKLHRPREETHEHREEIKRHRGKVRVPGIGAVAFHDVEAALDDVAADADLEELAVGANERRNSPGGDDGERDQHSGREPETTRQGKLAQIKFCADDSEKRQPGKRTFREKPEAKRDVERDSSETLSSRRRFLA